MYLLIFPLGLPLLYIMPIFFILANIFVILTSFERYKIKNEVKQNKYFLLSISFLVLYWLFMVLYYFGIANSHSTFVGFGVMFIYILFWLVYLPVYFLMRRILKNASIENFLEKYLSKLSLSFLVLAVVIYMYPFDFDIYHLSKKKRQANFIEKNKNYKKSLIEEEKKSSKKISCKV